MFITANYNAPMGLGDSQLIYERHQLDAYPLSEVVNLGNWREVRQWTDQLHGYIDQALLRQMHTATEKIDPAHFKDIELLIRLLSERVVPAGVREVFNTADPVTLRPHSGFTRYLPWEAMSAYGNLFGSGGFTLDPGIPQAPRHQNRPTALLVLDPTLSFREAPVAAHFERLRQTFAEQGLEVLSLANANYAMVREQLQNPSLAVIYFFGHIDRASNGDGQLVLRDETRLTASEIAKFLRPTANIVILNGCDAAARTTQDHGLQTLNVAEAFGRAGAQFVAGAAQRVSWQSAIAADEDLLLPFLTGEWNAATAANRMREISFARFRSGQADFNWALYRIFADPELTAAVALRSMDAAPSVADEHSAEISEEVRSVALAPGVTDLSQLQKHIVKRIAPSLIDIAPRGELLADKGDLTAYLAGFATRHPGAGIETLIEDLSAQNAWNAQLTGLPATAMLSLVQCESLINQYEPITGDARELLQRSIELSFSNGWHRLTNRAALASLMANADSYLAQACQVDADVHAPLLDFLSGLSHQGSDNAAPQMPADSPLLLLKHWLNTADKLRSPSLHVDERALALAFCQIADPEFKLALTSMPEPFDLDLDAANLEPVLGLEGDGFGGVKLVPSTVALCQKAHAIARAAGEHPISLQTLCNAYGLFGELSSSRDESQGDALVFPIDAHALPEAFSAAVTWCRQRYGDLIGANELLRGLWFHSNLEQRSAIAAQRPAGLVTTVEQAMLLFPESDKLLQILDEASLMASSQRQPQIRLPHLYCGALNHDTEALAKQLHIPLAAVSELQQDFMNSVIPGERELRQKTTSMLSESVQQLVRRYVESNPDQNYSQSNFRFTLAMPSHIVVEAVLSKYQQE